MQQVNKNFSKIEVLGSIGLFVATVLGLALINSPYSEYYEKIIYFPIGFGDYTKSLKFWINDGLICLFFMILGLEIKREFLVGELSEKSKLPLPISTATIGVIVPAMIYALFNHSDPINMRGWAIPTATDAAFCLGVLTLVGKRVPKSIKVFIISLAIIDDIIAVLVIAFFYANELSHLAVLLVAIIFGILVWINQLNINKKLPYIVLGFLLWLAMLKSGIHTSIMGVLLAITIPNKSSDNKTSMLQDMEHKLHPWVSFLVIPLFAFANAGVPLSEFNLTNLTSPLSLGIILGLFAGKQIGIFGTAYIMVKCKSGKLPTNATWMQMYGAASLCGIGFTMSLFIGTLAFAGLGAEYNNIVKAAIFVGSLLSAVVGYCALRVGDALSHKQTA